MVSFKDAWQAQRRQRQDEVVQRQQQVREILSAFQHDRQTKSSQLRSELSLFQLSLQRETQDFLKNASQNRQIQAEELARVLQDFTKALQQQTAQFLAATATHRVALAQQLFQDLDNFHHELITSVTALRQRLQSQIQDIQAQTQMLLKTHHAQRLQNHKQLVQALIAYMETLQSEVQTYLSELELARQDRAQRLRHMLQQDQDRRAAEMADLFQQLSAFRAELRQYCLDLHYSIWGEVASKERSVEASSGALIGSEVASAESMATSSASVAAPPASVETTPSAVEVAPESPSTAVINLPAALESSSQTEAERLEKEIYSYIHQIQGARLTEIETSLAISRFQAVDALRSLIKKGLITQRDRVYLVQEEVSL